MEKLLQKSRISLSTKVNEITPIKINLYSGESDDVYIQYVSGLKQTLLGKNTSNCESNKSDLENNILIIIEIWII